MIEHHTKAVINRDLQIQATKLAETLNSHSLEAVASQKRTIEAAWDLGELLTQQKEAHPELFDAFIAGAKIPASTAKHCLRIRTIADTREGLEDGNVMRQAMLQLLVPSKTDNGEERIELSPPQDWRKWVNAARIWSRKLEIGLQTVDLEAFVRETETVWTLLLDARRKLEGKTGAPSPGVGTLPRG